MRSSLLAGALALTLAASGAAHADPSVLTYHGALDRAGRYVVPGLTYERARGLHLDASFHAAYRGYVFAQPLLARRPGSGEPMLILANDRDEVTAIDARSGAQIWERTLGEPVKHAALPCGIVPFVGVTGTPVIDPERATLYLDAMVMREGEPRHEIYALTLADGSIEPGWPVDVASALKGSFLSSVQNQRGALALFAGRVFVPIAATMATAATFMGSSWASPRAIRPRSRVSRPGRAAAAFGGKAGSPAMASRCSRRPATRSAPRPGAMAKRSFVSIRASRAPPAPATVFVPSNWSLLDRGDQDLGATAPIPIDVPSAKGVRKLIFAIGKTGDAYLLDRDNLGGIGRPLLTAHVLMPRAITSPAVWSDGEAVFVALDGDGANCPAGQVGARPCDAQDRVDPTPAIETVWCAAVPNGKSSPIVTTTDGHASPIVFIVGADPVNTLYAFRGDNGEPSPRPRSLGAASTGTRPPSPQATGSISRAAAGSTPSRFRNDLRFCAESRRQPAAHGTRVRGGRTPPSPQGPAPARPGPTRRTSASPRPTGAPRRGTRPRPARASAPGANGCPTAPARLKGRASQRPREMRTEAAQRSGHEPDAHRLRADAGERAVHDSHGEARSRRWRRRRRAGRARSGRRSPRARRRPRHAPLAARGVRRIPRAASRRRSQHEKQDRKRRKRGGAKRALRRLISGLSGVPAHEGYVDAEGDDFVGVDEAGDRGEARGQPFFVSCAR